MLRFLDKWLFVLVRQLLPFCSESLADLGVVHLGVVLRDFSSLLSGPDHKRVHWALDMFHGFSHADVLVRGL